VTGRTKNIYLFWGCGIEKRGFLAYFGACQAKIPVQGWFNLNISRVRGWCGSVKLKLFLGLRTEPMSVRYLYFWNPQLKPSPLAPLMGDLIKGGGSECLVIELHGMPPSRPRGWVQANYQQLFPNLQFTHCIMLELHGWSKKVLWQRFWLDLCTRSVVSAVVPVQTPPQTGPISFPPNSKPPIPHLNARYLMYIWTIDTCWKFGILGSCVGPEAYFAPT